MESEKYNTQIIMSLLGTFGEFSVEELEPILHAALNRKEVNPSEFQVRRILERGVRCGFVQQHDSKYSLRDLDETDAGKRKKRKKKKSLLKAERAERAREASRIAQLRRRERRLREAIGTFRRPLASAERNNDRSGSKVIKNDVEVDRIESRTVVRRAPSSGRQIIEEYQPRQIDFNQPQNTK